MPAPSKLLTSLLFGTGLGAGPYGAAVVTGGMPTSAEVTQEREESKFGEICLLDEEMCKFMSDPTAHTDTKKEASATGGSDSSSKPWEKLSDDLLAERWDDVCVWGFHDQTLNNLAQCKPEKKSPASEASGGGAGSGNQDSTQASRR
ncbi:hypothetical protein [Candidatus Mycoplasma haematominutum]|uniref:Uncharacterized protein n=1 Tax=Candidatus Mycoplasma haematominutum 'Birmingham 1' TaxID=1116213 RepID=G8C317_9MOLU|nr:hypothetical protein [Candidatus Mycoplasma haematominutum]CCE66715.1 hypothetical protein (homolog to MSU_0422) [Candidatus Mycoplasma haematominutum 'Birmingham 1']